MAPQALGLLLHGPGLLLAICAHPRVRGRTVIDVMRDAPQATAAPWVRCYPRRSTGQPLNRPQEAARPSTVARRRRARGANPDNCPRWTAWAGTDPARTAFLAHTSFAFTDENELLDAGCAITAAPRGGPAT